MLLRRAFTLFVLLLGVGLGLLLQRVWNAPPAAEAAGKQTGWVCLGRSVAVRNLTDNQISLDVTFRDDSGAVVGTVSRSIDGKGSTTTGDASASSSDVTLSGLAFVVGSTSNNFSAPCQPKKG